MQLPESFTKPTPFSKILAMILFISLPFTGFVLGTKYQRIISSQNEAQLEYTKTIVTLTPSLPLNNNITDWGYQNNEMGFSLQYPKSWTTQEVDYIGKAKQLRISNKELEVAIAINYLKRDSEGQTGPTGMAGEKVKKGSFILAGKTLDRDYYLYKEDNGVNSIDVVYYSDSAKDRGLEFYIENLQLTVSVNRYMDENYHVGEALTPNRIQKAEEILSTLKLF